MLLHVTKTYSQPQKHHMSTETTEFLWKEEKNTNIAWISIGLKKHHVLWGEKNSNEQGPIEEEDNRKSPPILKNTIHGKEYMHDLQKMELF